MSPVNIEKARQFIEDKEHRRRAVLSERFKHAVRDFRNIVEMIISRYNPEKIYQWGSLLNESGFWEKSDIDIALQGLPSAKVFFDLFGDAMDMTAFPLDIVEIEKIEPEYRESIITNGKIIYERKQ